MHNNIHTEWSRPGYWNQHEYPKPDPVLRYHPDVGKYYSAESSETRGIGDFKDTTINKENVPATIADERNTKEFIGGNRISDLPAPSATHETNRPSLLNPVFNFFFVIGHDPAPVKKET